ncbi:MAG: phosphatidate cytidylyltransferase [Bacillota bacterium]|jgi:phosphatidate cytidylyltransferase
MLKTRIITAAIYVPILLFLIYWGGIPLMLGLGFLVAASLFEYGRMVEIRVLEAPYPLLIAAGIAIMVAVGYEAWAFLGLILMIILVLLILWTMMIKQINFTGIMLHFGGIIYIGLGFGFVLLLRLSAADFNILFLAFLITWATDVGAYFFGRTFGKKKLAPTISPNKTIAGAIGGIISATIITVIYGFLLMDLLWYHVVLLAIIGSVAGQFGDLWESLIKRWAGIKDSGNLFPGHGGALDRFDSILFVAPFVYFLLLFAA